MTTDRLGNLFVADEINNRVRKVNSGDTISNFAGSGPTGPGGSYSGDGGPATDAHIKNPCFITIDRNGNIFVSSSSYRIRKIDTNGIITTVAGNGTPGISGDGGSATTATIIGGPMAVDCAGNLFFADSFSRIRVVYFHFPPQFVSGHSQYLYVCRNSDSSIDHFLQVIDTNTGLNEKWRVLDEPMHGVVSGSYSTPVTGATLIPSGFTYTPAAGFVGADTFKIIVSNCGFVNDKTTFFVNVVSCPLAINEQSEKDKSHFIFPNPAQIQFSISYHQPGVLKIVNTLGATIAEGQTPAGTTTLGCSDWPRGLYFVVWHGDNGDCQEGKVIVR